MFSKGFDESRYLAELLAEAWVEDKHPRGFGGKFGSGTGVAKSDDSGGSAPAGPPAKKAAAAKKAPAKSAPTKASAKGKAAPAKTAPAPPSKNQSFLNDHYGGYQASLTPAQKRAITGYQGADYGIMQGQLRGGEGLDAADSKRAAAANRNLVAAIGKAPPLDEPMTVHRTMPAAMAAGLESGGVMGDMGFVSASLTPKKTSRGATVEIALPAGTKAAVGADGEMILPASGRFRVVSVEDNNGIPHVRMEFVPRGSAAKTKATTAAPEPKAAAKPKAKAPAKAAPAAPETAPDAPEKKAPSARKAPAKAKAPAAEPDAGTTSGMNGAARHETNDAGVKWLGKKMPNPKKDPFTASDRAALRAYTGPGYEAINEALRDPEKQRDADVQADIDGVDAAMAKSVVPEDVIVHRGVGSDFATRLGANVNDPQSMRAMIGKVSVEDSYLSTSAGQQAAFGRPIRLMMRVPKGARAVNVMPISRVPKERELLLDRNSSWVVHDAYESKGSWHVEVEQVPNGWQPGPGWKANSAGDADAGYTAIPSAGTGSVDDIYYQDMLDDPEYQAMLANQ